MDRPELESLLSLQSAPCLADWNQPGICTVLRSSPRPLPGLLSHLLLLLPHSFHSSSVSFSLLLEQTNFFLPQGLCLGCSICLELLQAPPPPGGVPPSLGDGSYRPYPSGYNHGYGLDEAFGCDQLVETEDLTGGHVETSLWHNTCG